MPLAPNPLNVYLHDALETSAVPRVKQASYVMGCLVPPLMSAFMVLAMT